MSHTELSPILTEMTPQGVAIITLNRPQLHNAFDEEMIKALTQAITDFAKNPLVKILLLKSTGKSFSAGANLDTMKKMASYSPKKNKEDAIALANLMYHLSQFPKPTIAAVQGAAFGGGVGLIACCHFAITSANATFCFPETKLGLIPAVISPYIVNAIGLRQARAYFLSGEPFDALKSYQMGLCYRTTPIEDLQRTTQQLIVSLLENGPQALEETNALMTTFQALTITPEIRDFTAQKIADLRASSEGVEGVNAFLENRKPSWIK